MWGCIIFQSETVSWENKLHSNSTSAQADHFCGLYTVQRSSQPEVLSSGVFALEQCKKTLPLAWTELHFDSECATKSV